MNRLALQPCLFAIAAMLFAPLALADDVVVAPCGKGEEGEGGGTYCTIQEGIDAAFAEGGGDVKVMPGVYEEILTLRPDVSVKGEEGLVVIQYPAGAAASVLVTASNESGLDNVTLRIPEDTAENITLLSLGMVEDVASIAVP